MTITSWRERGTRDDYHLARDVQHDYHGNEDKRNDDDDDAYQDSGGDGRCRQSLASFCSPASVMDERLRASSASVMDERLR